MEMPSLLSASDTETEDDPTLVLAAGHRSRLRRRPAVVVHARPQDSTAQPSAPPRALACGAEHARLADAGWWDPQRPPAVPFLPLPLDPPLEDGAPSSQARTSSGCGARVHAAGHPARVGMRWFGDVEGVGRMVIALDAQYFTEGDRMALELGRQRCGCTVEGVGCAICGNALGALHTPCPAHRAMPSHANPRKGQTHYIFLASAVSPPPPAPDPDVTAAPPEFEAESPRIQSFYPPRVPRPTRQPTEEPARAQDNEGREAQIVARTAQIVALTAQVRQEIHAREQRALREWQAHEHSIASTSTTTTPPPPSAPREGPADRMDVETADWDPWGALLDDRNRDRDADRETERQRERARDTNYDDMPGLISVPPVPEADVPALDADSHPPVMYLAPELVVAMIPRASSPTPIRFASPALESFSPLPPALEPFLPSTPALDPVPPPPTAFVGTADYVDEAYLSTPIVRPDVLRTPRTSAAAREDPAYIAASILAQYRATRAAGTPAASGSTSEARRLRRTSARADLQHGAGAAVATEAEGATSRVRLVGRRRATGTPRAEAARGGGMEAAAPRGDPLQAPGAAAARFPSVREQEAWLAAGAGGVEGVGTRRARRRASVPDMRLGVGVGVVGEAVGGVREGEREGGWGAQREAMFLAAVARRIRGRMEGEGDPVPALQADSGSVSTAADGAGEAADVGVRMHPRAAPAPGTTTMSRTTAQPRTRIFDR
ncbi:hypothetical protein DFH09DRAFT_1354719 [Mycena vulgaris]|nr:hypothetical protein DFH09DRAFT_1354719 [Mycena vulgaris]